MTRQENPMLSERGVTLLEMVVAVTLIAMMAVGLWAVFRISVRSWSRGTQFIDTNQRHRSILDMVRKQLASSYAIVVRADTQSGGGFYPLFSGTEGTLRFISLNSLRFQDNPGLTLVSYDVVRDRQGDYALVEREEQYLGQEPGDESFLERRDERITSVFEHLLSFTFEYFDPGNNERAPRWVREWNGEETRALPSAVSMSMIARDPSGNTFSRHMVVPIQAKGNDPRMNFLTPFGQRGGRVIRR